MSRRSKKIRAAAQEPNEQIRLDGWANLATGLGLARDKRTWATYLDVVILDDTALENLYVGNDLAARIIEAPIEHAMRDGYQINYSGDLDDVTDLQRSIEQERDRLAVDEYVESALCWGRLYGGGAVLLGVDDGSLDTSVALDDSRCRDVRFLNDIERRDLNPRTYYTDPREPMYGKPEIYELNQTSLVHESRLIETYGSRTPKRYRDKQRGWTLSVLQRVHDVIRDFDASFDAAANMVLDSSQAVLSQNGLIRSIGQLGASVIEGRMAAIDTYRASNRMIVLDREGEDFRYVERNLGGLDPILDKFMLRVAAAAKMPVTVLFGQAPAGLNATGASDLENWYAEVGSYRQRIVKPILERIIRLIAISLGSTDPESWSVEFPSLWIEGPEALANRSKLVADRDVAYINAGVYEPEEVALARAQGIDAEIVIDEDARRRQLELDMEKVWQDPEDQTPPQLPQLPQIIEIDDEEDEEEDGEEDEDEEI